MSPASSKVVYWDNSSSNWATPHIYYWTDGSDTSVVPAWPGTEMQPTEHNNIWKFDIGDYVNLIFNDGNNTDQTDDFTIGDEYHVFNMAGDTGRTLEEYLAPVEVDPTHPVTAYLDVPADWTSMYAYVYDSDTHSNATWPGEAMTFDSQTGYWYYDIPEEFLPNCQVIFCSNDTPANRYPVDKQPGLNINGTSMILHYTGSTPDWTEYNSQPDEPGDDITWKISFHNNVGWENVRVLITEIDPAIEGTMQSFLNSTIFDYEFTAPENQHMHCQFYTLVGGERKDLTPRYPLVNGHVYTVSGDKGPKDEYNPNETLPEAEYWLSPSAPSQNDKAILYFNRAYNSSSLLREVDDIYIYTGLIQQGADKSQWEGQYLGDWKTAYKMSRSDSNPDLYYVEFTPNIVSWYGCDPGNSYDRIALILRDKEGNIKQHDEDQFINLAVTAPVGEGLGAVSEWSTEDDGTVVFTSENGRLFLTPWSDNIIKVFTLRNNAITDSERRSISVIDDATKASYGISGASFSITEDDNEVILSVTDGVKAVVEKATSLVSFYNPGEDVATLVESGGLINRQGNVSVSFAPMGDTGFYGGGYNGNLINWEGNQMVMNNNQQGGWAQGGSLARNICIPFYVSTEGYGVYFDDHYKDATIRPTANGSTYHSKSLNPIAYYFIGGGSMEKVMQNYTGLTGRQELPPYWALGYITSKFSFATRTEAEETIAKTKAVNIPIDGIVFDIHWQTGSFLGTGTARMGRIDWERSAYPDPVGMMKNFRDQNVHTLAITEPFFTSNSYNYDYLKENGYFSDDDVSGMGWLQSDKVGLLDVTKQGARDWFKDLYKKRTAEGIESWWLDLGEPERHDAESTYEEGSFQQVHNEYGNLWTEIAYEAMKEQSPESRFILMPRAGTAGMQRLNTFPWTGDIARSWGGLAAQVPSLISASMSGVGYLGSDIGGFTAYGTDADLYRRWVQLGVFYPSMRTHSATAPEVWQTAYDGVRNDVRDAMNLRYVYLPYTYSQSYAYTRFGTPIARPANFADENKGVLKNEIGAYLWGPDVFVAPVLDSSSRKNITFPEGDWLDMNDFTTVYEGHTTTNYNAPADVLPHFMRRGSFVPRYTQETYTSTAEIATDRITIDHFAPKSEALPGSIYYEDDHSDVNAIRDGKYLLLNLSSYFADDNLMLSVTTEGNGWAGMAPTRDIHIRIHDFKMTHEGGALPQSMIRLHATQAEQSPASRHTGIGLKDTNVSTPFLAAANEDEVKNADGPMYHHDTANNKLYIRIPQASAQTHYTVQFGNRDVVTGVESPLADGSLMLTAANDGIITYSAPEGMTGLQLEIFSSTGVLSACYTNLSADGYAAQVEPMLRSGIYVARLSGCDSCGNTASKTVKFAVSE
ncbi:MAG: starch-binding protein [Muribaculaceae bacterium]|nr:starch-binding protein [Muribaculaceae bacterium]